MNKLASIQFIKDVCFHPNADRLEIAKILGYSVVVQKGRWKAGQLCVFIHPDSVLPQADWSQIYKKKSNRVKAIKLRNIWSEGIVETIENIGYQGKIEEGLDISSAIGVIKYDPPVPQDLSAKGPLPFGIPKTDEPRIESLDDDQISWGELVDVTLKIDGQSASYYFYIDDENRLYEGVLGRTMEYDPNAVNNYTQNNANFDILNKLSYFCRNEKISGLCIRGESFGRGIQKGKYNPHSKGHLNWAMFSVWDIKNRQYANKGSPLYFAETAVKLRLPTVPILEKTCPSPPN